jgi:hypothetical protein
MDFDKRRSSGLEGKPPRSSGLERKAPRRAASIEDLDDGPEIQVKHEPWDPTGIFVLLALAGVGLAVLKVRPENFTMTLLVLVSLGVAFAHAMPESRSRVVMGVAVVILAICWRFGAGWDRQGVDALAKRNADLARETHRGEVQLQRRLEGGR